MRICWASTSLREAFRGGAAGRGGGAVVGFALFFHNYSTFQGRPGIYLEDLFVEPHRRGQGHGKALMREVARAGGATRLWQAGVERA